MVGSFKGESEPVPGSASICDATVSGGIVLSGATIDVLSGVADGSANSDSGLGSGSLVCVTCSMVCYSVCRDIDVRCCFSRICHWFCRWSVSCSPRGEPVCQWYISGVWVVYQGMLL